MSSLIGHVLIELERAKIAQNGISIDADSVVTLLKYIGDLEAGIPRAAVAAWTVDASAPPDGRYEAPQTQDVLRRIPDLLKGDLIVFNGVVRKVDNVRLSKHNPNRAWLMLADDLIDPDPGRIRVLEYSCETRVRVLRSHWEAPDA